MWSLIVEKLSMELEQKPGKRFRKGIYLLPNLFTTAGLFAGFFAIVSAMDGRHTAAAIAIFVALIMDGMDGRVARMTNSQTSFGAQYDSLSDIVSFGIAPALLVYSWSLLALGKIGWLVSFVFVAAVALRLARFNTFHEEKPKAFFYGLPCPAAAGAIAGVIWLGQVMEISGLDIAKFFAMYVVFLAASMVSNMPYHSFKNFDIRGRVPFIAMLIVVLTFVAIALDPPPVLTLLFLGYALSGPIFALWRLRHRKTK